MRDHYPADSKDGSAESQRTATSLDVSVGLRNSVLLSAGYTYFDSAQSDNGEELQAMASVGVELPITSGGTLRLGMSSAWPRGTFDLIQAGSPLDDTAVRSTAELGLSYDFENETTLRLNYRLIDFTTVNPSYGATAEFSIKF
jgi:opacity protein-like surface antigen